MRSNRFAFLLSAALIAFGIGACGTNETPGDDDDDGADAGPIPTSCQVTPSTWAAPDFEVNAAEALALRTHLDELTGGAMRDAEQGVMFIDEVSDLMVLYQAGQPSMADVASPGYDPIVGDALSDFVDVVMEGPSDLVDDEGNWVPGDVGGVFSSSARALNAGGVEVRQIVDKGLFGGSGLYRYALSLTEGTITPATIDAMAAAWGSNATLDSADTTDSAGYAFRMGFHADIARALTDAKAYAADSDCVDERDEAIRAFFRAWEKALIARTVYYANVAATELTTATDDDGRAGGLHELAEGIGLALGFYRLPEPTSGPMAGGGRIIADADIEDIMTALALNIGDLSASGIGELIEAPQMLQSGVGVLEAKVKQVYEIDDVELASYREPTEG